MIESQPYDEAPHAYTFPWETVKARQEHPIFSSPYTEDPYYPDPYNRI